LKEPPLLFLCVKSDVFRIDPELGAELTLNIINEPFSELVRWNIVQLLLRFLYLFGQVRLQLIQGLDKFLGSKFLEPIDNKHKCSYADNGASGVGGTSCSGSGVGTMGASSGVSGPFIVASF